MPGIDKNGIFFLTDYEPWHSGENPNFTKDRGGYLLDVKENYDKGITYYSNIFNKHFTQFNNMEEEIIVTCVPSSEVGQVGQGLVNILLNLEKKFSCFKYMQCLERIREIDKLASGGNRSQEVHFNSIRVCNRKLFYDKNILLLDDVTTTGGSLLACKKILKDAGAKKVLCLALAKTV